MANPVNPPPFLRLPKAFFDDPQVRSFVEQQQTILFQLYRKLGGSSDPLAEIPSLSDEATINMALSTRPAQLFSQQVQINNASDRIEANETDLLTRPRTADLYKTNQRVNELIDELIEQLEKLNESSSSRQKDLISLQSSTLSQLKLLNARTEEAFNTQIEEIDIE